MSFLRRLPAEGAARQVSPPLRPFVEPHQNPQRTKLIWLGSALETGGLENDVSPRPARFSLLWLRRCVAADDKVLVLVPDSDSLDASPWPPLI